MLFSPETVSSNNKLWGSVVTTVAASDSVPTQLRRVDGATASFQDDLVLGAAYCTAVPDPSNPANVLVKTWKPTSATDPTPVAATTFGKKVSVIAWGV